VLQLSRNTAGFEAPRVLDLCTGSGCIAAAIAHHLKSSTIVAIDISDAALAIARRNIEQLQLSERITFEQVDLYEPFSRIVDAQPFDLIVSNPPYIATAGIEQLDRSVRDYEPKLALDGGLDGLVITRRILEGAPQRLRAGGRLYIEIAFDQAAAALDAAKSQDALEDVRILKDNAGNDRVLTAKRKS
jgi:release factor glutamine methyltransferase